MKKIITLTILLLSIITFINAQGYSVTSNAKDLDLLKQNGITVVLPEGKLGEVLQKTITENWTASKFEFITEKELASFENGKKLFLLGLFKGEIESAKDYIKNTPFIGIVNTYDAKNKYKPKMDASASIVYPEDAINEANLESSMLMYVKILQNLVNSGGVKKHVAQINETGKTASKKTTIVCKDNFKGATTDIKKDYSGKISKVERDIYNQAITNNDDVLIGFCVESSVYQLFTIVENKTGLIVAYMFTSSVTPKSAKSIQEYTFKRLSKL